MHGPATSLNIGTNAMNQTIAPVQFANCGYPESTSVLALQMWTDFLAEWAGSEPVTYNVGDLVMDGLHLHRCVTATTNEDPRPSADTNNKWEDLGVPVDDLRISVKLAARAHRSRR